MNLPCPALVVYRVSPRLIPLPLRNPSPPLSFLHPFPLLPLIFGLLRMLFCELCSVLFRLSPLDIRLCSRCLNLAPKMVPFLEDLLEVLPRRVLVQVELFHIVGSGGENRTGRGPGAFPLLLGLVEAGIV